MMGPSDAVGRHAGGRGRIASRGAAVVAGVTTGLVLLSGAATRATAQPAAGAVALKSLEGREVRLRLDMPASAAGIDLHLQREPEIDAALHTRRITEYGVAIRQGQTALITKVKVNKKNIEVHLGGGGYGTFGDDDGLVVAKLESPSPRQTELERERGRTTDAQRKREIDRELADLREALRRQHDEAFRHAAELTAVNKRRIAIKRLDAGSRFNIWYQDKRLEQWVPTPEELTYSLAAYLEVLSVDDGRPPSVTLPARASNGPAARSATPSADSIRAGMTTAEVYRVLGFPSRRRSSPQGDLDGTVETWEAPSHSLEVTFVGGVVVKFTSSSK